MKTCHRGTVSDLILASVSGWGWEDELFNSNTLTGRETMHLSKLEGQQGKRGERGAYDKLGDSRAEIHSLSVAQKVRLFCWKTELSTWGKERT